MTGPWRIARLAAVSLVTSGLAACSGSNWLGTSAELTTQSTPVAAAKPAEPDCPTMKAEIDKLTAADLPAKLKKAADKKYTPTADEWSQFPRYNQLIETYSVKKCEPSLQQASKTKAKPAKAAEVAPKQKIASNSTAGTAPAVIANDAVQAQQAVDSGAPVEGVSIKIPR